MVAGAVLANPEPMLARLVRGCIALAFTACVPTDQSSPRHANAVKGGELSSMALAREREPTVVVSIRRVQRITGAAATILTRLSLYTHTHVQYWIRSQY